MKDKILQKYGSTEAALNRLNELQSQDAFIREVGITSYTLMRFLLTNNIIRVQRWVINPDARPAIQIPDHIKEQLKQYMGGAE